MENPKFEQPVDTQEEKKYTEDELGEVEFQRDWYEPLRRIDESGNDFREDIINGLGSNLGIPGYGENEGAPTEEQQARLEELYQMVIASSENEPTPTDSGETSEQISQEKRNEKFGEAATEALDNTETQN